MSLSGFLFAKLRGFAPLSCFQSPRTDVFRGWKRWRWLVAQRRTGRLIDPSVQIRSNLPVSDRLLLGPGACLDRGSIVWLADECGEMARITLGEGSYIGPHCYLGSCHHLIVGENTMVGAYSYLITANHRQDLNDVPVIQQGYEGGDIRIGRNVWLGCHVVVLPGVTIGDGAIVGAGAVVTGSIPGGEIWGGVPAKKIRDR